MKGKQIRLLAALMTALLLLAVPMGASAAKHSAIGLNQSSASLTLIMDYVDQKEGQQEHTLIPGVKLAIYKVFDLNADGSYTLTPDFAGAGIAMKDGMTAAEFIEAGEIADEIMGERGIQPVKSAVTGENGAAKFTFEADEFGVYLVRQTGKEGTVANDYDYITSYLVQVPQIVDGGWVTDVVSKPKFEYNPVPFGDADIIAEKVWDDNNNEKKMRKDIILELWQSIDGGEPQKVQGSEKTIKADATGDDLMVTWQMMPQKTTDGKDIVYSVREATQLEGYNTPVIERITGDATNGFQFKITNKITPPGETPPGETPPGETPPKNPPTNPPSNPPSTTTAKRKTTSSTTPSTPVRTGDATNIIIWIAIVIAALAAIVAIILKRRKDGPEK